MTATDGSPSRSDRAIGLIVTDLDGTLWERPEAVPAATRRALHDVVEADIPLLVATGRRVVSTRDPLLALGVRPPAVVLNGALGLDLATNRRFHVGGFDAADAVRVLAVFAAYGIDPCIYVDHDAPSVWVGPEPSTHPDHLRSFGDDVGAGRLDEIVADHAVLAFGVLGIPESVASAIGDALRDLAMPHVAPDRQYGGHTLTVAPPDQSKWDGIAAYCSANGIDAQTVLAMGDGPNDLEMLEHALVAVVPADAHPAALELADQVIGTAADGGWADVIHLL